jgi:hypothetical protein
MLSIRASEAPAMQLLLQQHKSAEEIALPRPVDNQSSGIYKDVFTSESCSCIFYFV